MAVLHIVKYGSLILRKKAKPVDPKDPGLKKLAQDMTDTMIKARGVGLAGNQVGELRQIAIVDIACEGEGGAYRVVLNPVIVESKGEVEKDEGCLSFPDIRGTVVRPTFCRVRAQGLDGETFEISGKGALAQCLQHEIDHLQGILFVDRMRLASKTLVTGKLKELSKETKASVKGKG